jgi:hypothetical protein
LDEIIAYINKRIESLKTIIDIFSVLWEFKYMTEGEIKLKSRNLVLKYNNNLQKDLVDELQSLNIVHATNFGHKQLNPIELLNHLQKTNLANMFSNLCIALRLFLTIPATVASAERSFSTLKKVKNVLRSTMTQQRLSSLGVLAVKAQMAKTIDMDGTIDLTMLMILP